MEIDWSTAPEGATHWGPDTDRHCESWYEVRDGEIVRYLPADDALQPMLPAVAGSAYYHPVDDLVGRPAPWTGEGLPPVGTVCEYYADDGVWRSCEIVAHKDGQAVVWVSNAHIWASSGASLRPIRTPEQIAAEQALAEIERLYSEGGPAAVFDAGYRKQA